MGENKNRHIPEKISIFNTTKDIIEETDKIRKTASEWRAVLTNEQYAVTRKKITGKQFSEKFDKHTENGIYQCVCCGTDLFNSDSKFDSLTGWPSFSKPVSELNIRLKEVNSHKIEAACSRCDAHLGFLVKNLPPHRNEKYYRINSAALKFMKRNKITPP